MNATAATIVQRLRADGLYTQAGNFLSHVSTGVDPRTGQFTLGCSLPGLQANDLAGPLISPSLHFSPLNSHSSSGFGLGWSMSFSQLDFITDRLVISSGDSFKLDRNRSDFSRDGLLEFFDQKLCTFQVFADDDAGRRFRIEYKDGITEYLEVQERSDTALLVEVCSPQGRRAYLEWIPANGPFLLWKVRDEEREMLEIQWQPGEVRLVLFPGSTSTAIFTLSLNNDQLIALILPDGDSRWIFDYHVDEYSGLLFPSQVLGPLGSVDDVVYASGSAGHLLPEGAPLAYLPRVLTHRHDPGAEQPVTYKSFIWVGDYNFFGYRADVPGGWQDGQDHLYRTDRYDYTCIETLTDEQKTTLLTVERSWNRFHLQTREITTRGANTVEVLTTYGDNPLVGWEDQPAWCQLPVATTTRFARGDAFREEQTTRDYDAYGNVWHQLHADGTEEYREYYAVGGEEGCPDDGGVFVRWLKRYTTTAPAPDPQTPGYNAHTDYAYTTLSKLQPQDRQHLVLTSERAFEQIDGVEVAGATIEQWTEQQASSPFHGMPTRSVITYNGFAATTDFLRTFEGPLLCETQQRTSHDHLVLSSSTLKHLLTGLTVEERDEQAGVTVYEHDVLGRCIHRMESAHTPYAVSTTCTHQLAGRNRTQTVIAEQIDSNGQHLRVVLDGDGRVVREILEFLDSPSALLHEVRRVTHDALGNIVAETTQDWLAGQQAPLCINTVSTAYDDWGTASRVSNPDGTVDHTQHDPILRKQVRWQQSADGEEGPRTTVYMNASGSVERTEVHEAEHGAWLRREYWTLDARQRPVTHTIETSDGERRTTATVYDRDGRVAERTLPDQTRVKWAFTPQSDGDAIAKLSLCAGTQEWLLLEQTFDGLDRPLTRSSGGQHETLRYQPGQIPPDTLTRSNGVSTRYDYEPSLNYQIKGIARPSENSQSTFTYSVPQGRLTHATGGLGSMSWDFTASGVTRAEHWHHDGDKYTAGWTYSLNGRVLSFTDVRGETTRCSYDAFGRLSGQYTASLLLQLTYDAFGRLASTLTTDDQQGQSQQQTLTYDLQGRERSREWLCHSAAGEQRFRQTLSWTAHDQVATRRWETIDGTVATLLIEDHYLYDVRGRLVETRAQGPELVTDPRTGLRIRRQQFFFNALDGYERVDTEYENGQSNSMAFAYDAEGAADRPVRITHSWPQALVIDLEYDAAGQLTRELHDGQLWRELHWNSQGHLTRREDLASTCEYAYDPLGRLVETKVNDLVSRRFYDGPQMVNEHSDQGWLSLMRAGSTVFAQSLLSQAVRTVVMSGSDGQGSVRVETGDTSHFVGYSAHGLDNGTAQSRVGYAGEVRERDSPLYMPGSNRPYDPCLMMFLSPDTASPEGAGGLSRYAYCSGDPVNRIDPDGHSWWTWVVGAVGLVLGAAAVILSAGTAAPAVGAAYSALIGAGAGTTAAAAGAVAAVATSSIAGAISVASVAVEAIALGTGVASFALEASGNEKAGGILGWVSFGTGIASAGLSIGASAVKAASKAQKVPGILRRKLMFKNSATAPAEFSTLGKVTEEPLATAKSSPWKIITERPTLNADERRFILAADRKVNSLEINDALKYIVSKDKQRDIVVLGGNHGNPQGRNWNVQRVRRNSLSVPDMFDAQSDVYTGSYRNRVRVVDLTNMRTSEFKTYLENSDVHVVLGYCYSRNDQALRHFKNLAPVVSYVP